VQTLLSERWKPRGVADALLAAAVLLLDVQVFTILGWRGPGWLTVLPFGTHHDPVFGNQLWEDTHSLQFCQESLQHTRVAQTAGICPTQGVTRLAPINQSGGCLQMITALYKRHCSELSVATPSCCEACGGVVVVVVVDQVTPCHCSHSTLLI